MDVCGKKGTALIRTVASETVGLGHVMRCLVLARGLRASGLDVQFVSEGEVARKVIVGAGFEMLEAVGDVGGADDRRRLCELATARAAVVIVLDGYPFPSAFLADCSAIRCVVDDRLDRRWVCDVDVNPNLYASRPSSDGAHVYLYGPQYALLRDEFAASHANDRIVRATADRVLVIMGGADPALESVKVVRALEHLGRRLSVRVVAGAASGPLADAVRAAVTTTSHDVEVWVQPESVAELMEWCDVAVSAAGTSAMELACVGTPAVVIAVAENQRLVADALKTRGLAWNLGFHSNVTHEVISLTVEHLLDDAKARQAMVDAQRMCVDGLGQSRVTTCVMDVCRDRGKLA